MTQSQANLGRAFAEAALFLALVVGGTAITLIENKTPQPPRIDTSSSMIQPGAPR